MRSMRDVNFMSTINIKVNAKKKKNQSLVLNKTFVSGPRFSQMQMATSGASNRQLMETNMQFAS